MLCTLSDERYLTVTGRQRLPKDVVGIWDLPSSGILRKEQWYFLTDVEGTAIGATFKSREIQEQNLFQDADEQPTEG